jgi:hypothetical protein
MVNDNERSQQWDACGNEAKHWVVLRLKSEDPHWGFNSCMEVGLTSKRRKQWLGRTWPSWCVTFQDVSVPNDWSGDDIHSSCIAPQIYARDRMFQYIDDDAFRTKTTKILERLVSHKPMGESSRDFESGTLDDYEILWVRSYAPKCTSLMAGNDWRESR